jgi:hypothetical protein
VEVSVSLEKHEVERLGAEIATSVKGVPKVTWIAKIAWRDYECETTGASTALNAHRQLLRRAVKS